MKISATIQARMGSTRLPGKVLKKIHNISLLEWQVSRLKRSLLLDDIVVATSTNPDDKEILEDLIIASVNQAQNKFDEISKDKMGAISGGLPGGLPGF